MAEAGLRERITQSRANREAMIDKFGMMPYSILRLSRGAESQMIHNLQHEHPERHPQKQEGAKLKRERLRAAGYKGGSASGGGDKGTLGVSIMPAELVAFFIRYYSAPGEVYLDPFMGQGVRLQVALKYALGYHGYDCSEEFFAYIDATVKMTNADVAYHLGDSRYPDLIEDNIGDFCFTSPPYWDIEYYGSEGAQLGYKQTYTDFLIGMFDVAKAWHSKFKTGATVIINVNDFRKDGKFYSYHADTIKLFKDAGYILTDTWIIEGLVGGMPKAFAVDFNLKRIAPKVHEYALVFKA